MSCLLPLTLCLWSQHCLYVPGHFLSVYLWFLVLAGLLFCLSFSGTYMLFTFHSLSDYYKLEVRNPDEMKMEEC